MNGLSRSSVLLGGLLLLAAYASFANAVPLVSPSANSDVVLGLRAQPTGELKLEYQEETPDHKSQNVSVGIAADYHYVRSQQGLRVYDYRLRRILQVRGQNNFVNDSLFADAWYRVMELQNRVMLRRMMQGAGLSGKAPAETVDPFWVETELGVVSSEFPRPSLNRTEDKASSRWLLGKEEIAAARFGTQAVPQEVQGSLRRFWATFARLHPAIVADLAGSNRIPEELTAKVVRIGQPPGVTRWKLISAHWEPSADYPLPRHLAAQPTVPDGGFPDIFATLAAEVADKKVPPPQDSYVGKANAAIERGAGLEAMLWVFEMNLAGGRTEASCAADDPRPFCTLSRRAGPLAKMDPRTAVAFKKQSPDLDERPQFDQLPNAYLLRLLWATRAPGKGVQRSETERGLLTALRASAVANFCKDTGDFYAAGWQPFAAWQAWDFGRLMAGHVDGDFLDQINTLESRLATDQPSLF